MLNVPGRNIDRIRTDFFLRSVDFGSCELCKAPYQSSPKFTKADMPSAFRQEWSKIVNEPSE